MSTHEVTKKVSFVGQWHEDVFSDELVKKIAAHAKAQKGKKLKMNLSPAGLKLTRSKFLKDSKTTFFSINSIKTVARNPGYTACVMFILSDPNKKYKIIALRTPTEGDSLQVANVFSEIKKGLQSTNIELRKRENGNWTLRERSAHNANRHLAEIFNERKQSNGEATVKPNGDVSHVPVLDAGKVETNGKQHKGVYKKRTTVNNNTKHSKDDDDDNYVIETEVTSYPYTTTGSPSRHDRETEALRGDLNGLEREMREIKAALEHSTANDYRDGGHHSPTTKYPPHQVLPSKPVVYTATSKYPTVPQIVVHKAPPNTYESRVTTSPAGYYTNPWASHRRVSGTSGQYAVPTRVSMNPGSSVRGVAFDQVSLRSNSSRISKSPRWRASDITLSTTIERPIEETYARPVVIRRVGGHMIAQRPRPASYHVVGTNEMRVYRSDDRHLDAAL